MNLDINYDLGTFTVLAPTGCTMKAAFENVRAAILKTFLEMTVHECIDQVSTEAFGTWTDLKFKGESNTAKPEKQRNVNDNDFLQVASSACGQSKVFRPHDNRFYAGNVDTVSEGKHNSTYDDCDVNSPNIFQEAWCICRLSSKIETFISSYALNLQSSSQADLEIMLINFECEVILQTHLKGISAPIF